ncbi:prolyl oligopeptidase family serine peptidase [Pollutibacter soli]|uniref:carboxylesterase family protein n=1 Tax=Pollutibacter soli TaxID=3034157 RepID=UPI00301403AB
MRKVLVFAPLLMWFLQSNAQVSSLFEEQLFIEGDDTLRCRILTPQNFSTTKKFPLVVFLHGAGERGTDNEKQLTWGADLFLDSVNRAKYPAIVVFPQCPENEAWSSVKRGQIKDTLGGFEFDTAAAQPKTAALVIRFIDSLVAKPGVDQNRVYLGGLSMGGFGTFEFLWRRPDLFAAAFPICGGGVPAKVHSYAKKLPIWIFHGDADPIVPVTQSRRMVRALQKTTAEIKYTEYPGVQHESWKNAFAEPGLMEWIFSKKKPTR